MKKEDLLKLIQDDEFDLLKVKPKQSTGGTPDERLIASFLEINQFVEEHGREPSPGQGIHEHKLHSRLKGIRASREKIKKLLSFDEYELLDPEVKEVKSIQDVFEDDDLGILESEADEIFSLKHVPKKAAVPDYIAQRKKCEDFEKYEQQFSDCQAALAAGKRKLLPFAKGSQIEKGQYFVLKGVLLLVADVGTKETVNGVTNARLLVIFENGTESDMLLRSLAAELYKDGRRVTEHDDRLLDGLSNITDEDEETGYIYVLRSLSDKPEIQSIDNLYKIGFSREPIEERVKNAAKEPTYLMAPVSIVTAFKCYNMNPQKLELLLHTFFGSACLNLDVFDEKGRRHSPREWFIAPLNIIEDSISLVLSGEIIHYRYDHEQHRIVKK